jgi:hypothetical protein
MSRKTDPKVLELPTVLANVLRAAVLDGYSSGNVNDNGNGTSYSDYRNGPWQIIDHWGGGHPSVDLTEVFYEDVLCWSMTGRDDLRIPHDESYAAKKTEIIDFLKEALTAPNNDCPVRGPGYYGTGELRYHCDSLFRGEDHPAGFDIGNFFLKEEIVTLDGEALYAGYWQGGWTNLR